MDCTRKNEYICAHCNISSILNIDILGRVAHVGDQKIILSLCCASLIYYKGTGHELSTVCGPQCTRDNQFSKGRTVFLQVVNPLLSSFEASDSLRRRPRSPPLPALSASKKIPATPFTFCTAPRAPSASTSSAPSTTSAQTLSAHWGMSTIWCRR